MCSRVRFPATRTHVHFGGAVSSTCVGWALTILILRADNHGEGGGLALTALAAQAVGQPGERPRLRCALLLLGVAGATLFYGDSVITPAISVLGAVEGLEVATPALKPCVVPASLAILVGLLRRRGVLVADVEQTYLAEPDANGEEARTLRPLQAAAITYRIAFGPRAGRKLLTLRGVMPCEDRVRQPLCADIDACSLHAAVRVEAHDRQRLEQLCR